MGKITGLMNYAFQTKIPMKSLGHASTLGKQYQYHAISLYQHEIHENPTELPNFWFLPSGIICYIAIEAMADRNSWFTELKDGDFPQQC